MNKHVKMVWGNLLSNHYLLTQCFHYLKIHTAIQYSSYFIAFYIQKPSNSILRALRKRALLLLKL